MEIEIQVCCDRCGNWLIVTEQQDYFGTFTLSIAPCEDCARDLAEILASNLKADDWDA